MSCKRPERPDRQFELAGPNAGLPKFKLIRVSDIDCTLANYTFLTFVCQASEPNVDAASTVVTSKGFSNILNVPRESALKKASS